VILIDGRTRLSVVVLEVPAFPRHLEDRLQQAEAGATDEARAFLDWWVEACVKRGFRHGRWPVAEEWVHARRLLTRHTPDQLKRLAVHFFAAFAREEWQGPQLLRLFWHLLPNVEEEARSRGG
jgi:hypothetical protein